MSDEPFVQKGPEPLTKRLDIRVSKSQKEKLRAAADERGIHPSELLRTFMDSLEPKQILEARKKALKEELFQVEMRLAAVATEEARREEEREREELEEAVQPMREAFERDSYTGLMITTRKASPETMVFFREWLVAQPGDKAAKALEEISHWEDLKKKEGDG